MSALLEVYRAQFKTSIGIMLQYRIAMVIWLIGLVVEPVIYLVVWSTVARSSGGQVGTFTSGDFAAYFIVMMLVNHATFTWIMHEFEYRIRHGQFSPKLLRPIHPIHADIADNIGYKTITLAVILPASVGLMVAFRPAVQLVPWAAAAFVPALVLAFVLRFLVEWSLALVAFWVTRVAAINQMYFVALLFLSGRVAPLELFPAPIRWLAAVLPFRWMVAFPVELLLGRLTTHETLIGLAAQGAWLLLSLAIMTLLWRTAMRHYSAVGA